MDINLWDFIYDIYIFFINVIDTCSELWNSSFKVGDYVITFKSVLTGSLILVMGLLLVKKLIPVA